LIDGHFIGFGRISVVGFDFLQVLVEYREFSGFFGERLVSFSVLSFEGNPLGENGGRNLSGKDKIGSTLVLHV
jgi:hypothetical protein